MRDAACHPETIRTMDASQLLLEQCSCKNANSQFHLSIHQFNIKCCLDYQLTARSASCIKLDTACCWDAVSPSLPRCEAGVPRRRNLCLLEDGTSEEKEPKRMKKRILMNKVIKIFQVSVFEIESKSTRVYAVCPNNASVFYCRHASGFAEKAMEKPALSFEVSLTESCRMQQNLPVVLELFTQVFQGSNVLRLHDVTGRQGCEAKWTFFWLKLLIWVYLKKNQFYEEIYINIS